MKVHSSKSVIKLSQDTVGLQGGKDLTSVVINLHWSGLVVEDDTLLLDVYEQALGASQSRNEFDITNFGTL